MEVDKTVDLGMLKKEKYKFSQSVIRTGTGVEGKIYLNGEKMYEFSDIGSEDIGTSKGIAFKEGDNEMILEITSVGDKPEAYPKPDAKKPIIEINFKYKESNFLSIAWNPGDAKKIKYVFKLEGNGMGL